MTHHTFYLDTLILTVERGVYVREGGIFVDLILISNISYWESDNDDEFILFEIHNN